MTPSLFVRELTPAESAALRAGLRSGEAFTLRRAQVLLASAAGRKPADIAAALGCAPQTVRDAIRAFRSEGAACLAPKSRAPRVPRACWPRERDADLQAMLHQSPRTFGRPTGLWTLALAAAVCRERGWTDRELSGEAVRQVLARLGVGWKRAKHWLVSPDPEYAAKKKPATT